MYWSICRATFLMTASMVCACTSIVAGAETAQEPASIIPVPALCQQRDGVFVIGRSTQIVAEGDAAGEAAKLVDLLEPAMGYRLSVVDSAPRAANSIRLRIDPSLTERPGSETYELNVTDRSITIGAVESSGLFYGIATLRQLLPPAIFSRQKVEGVRWTVPCLRIVDYPRFEWRGLLIDPARHFIPVEDVKLFIDAMALHKFNRLQIHLTDDHGWRIEIKKYPQLTKIGSKMDFTTMRQQGGAGKAGDKPIGGFYTQDEIRELVRYASDRYITIVPEIEMPAHTGSAIVSYPEIGLYPQKLEALAPQRRWTANERVLAPRPRTVAFMQDVLAEVMEMFPGSYIHIGGDEANTNRWKQSEEMQKIMRQSRMEGVDDLHSRFIKQMDAFLTRHGRRLVGWDEILQGGLAQGATVMSWRGQGGGITAAKAGHDVVMAPTSHTYFDYYQGPKEAEPRAIGGYIPLEKVYEFEPIPAELDVSEAKHVLGGQGQLWGEYIPNREHREYMTYPRAAALSEVLWSPKEGHNYESFHARLRQHLGRLDAAGVNYRRLDSRP